MNKPLVVEADGFKWWVENDDDHLALGGHEAGLYPVLIGLANPTKAFLNVGAHIGLWAIRMAEYTSEVYAVEANFRTAHKLNQNIELNNLKDKVFVLNYAAWNEDNKTLVLVDENDMATGGSTRVEPMVVGPRGKEKAYSVNNLTHTAKLDSFYFDVSIGLLTLDVEGAEAKALEGARELIMRDRPNIVIELHEGHPGTDADLRDQVYSLLDSMNYSYASVEITGERLICTPNEQVLDEPETVQADLHNPDEPAIVMFIDPYTKRGTYI